MYFKILFYCKFMFSLDVKFYLFLTKLINYYWFIFEYYDFCLI